MDTNNFQVQGTMLIKVMSRASSKVSMQGRGAAHMLSTPDEEVSHNE